MRSGDCSETSCASAAAAATPGSMSPGSIAYSFVAPYSPVCVATALASLPEYTASTAAPLLRASVSSSSVADVTLSPVASAKTHTLLSAIVCVSSCSRASVVKRTQWLGSSDELQALEETDDLLGAGAVVLELLAGLARRCLLDVRDLLPRTRPTDVRGVESEVARGDLVDRLALRRHDPLERRVARLDDT